VRGGRPAGTAHVGGAARLEAQLKALAGEPRKKGEREAPVTPRPPETAPAWLHGDDPVQEVRRLPRREWWRFAVRPETLLRWHRELVRRTWAAFGQRRGPGRPPLAPDVRALILRVARENPRWGSQRIHGEFLKLGHVVAATTVQTVLRRYRVPPVPRRAGLAWPACLRAHAAGLLACDFFCVETVRLHTLYVLVSLEVQTRRVVDAGCPAHPTADWVTQQARNACWHLAATGRRPTVLVRDRDATFAPAFDAVFAAAGGRVLRTPVRAPRANAFAERWVGTARREGLDRHPITGERPRRPGLRESAEHDTAARPHRSLRLHPPLGPPSHRPGGGGVWRRDRLGGLLHEYQRAAA
jgi:hypothetical protein